MNNKKKNVLITGCNGRIGKALAISFKKKGYIVHGLDQNPTDIKGLDFFLQSDLKQYATDINYRNDFEKKLGKSIERLDVLINNAAVQILGSIKDIKLNDWNETLNVNLTSCMLLCHFFYPFLKKTNGSIINIGSIHQNLTKKNFLAYSTSKSALIGFTKALSVDIGSTVRVNAISPAAIDTPMLRAGFDFDEEKIEELRKIHPTKNIGNPYEVANVAIFLSNSENHFMNGANITLDGGISNVLSDL